MSEKVKLPREVAEALEKSKHIGPAAIMGHLSTYTDAQTSTEELSLIYRHYKNNPYIMASAIINGYEIATTPEERVNNMFKDAVLNERDGSIHTQRQWWEGRRMAIIDTLNALEIKIDGVNK